MTSVLVIGGGPAGSALAISLARAGRDVVLVERSRCPSDKVCGEFLSHEATGYLDALGLDLAGLGAVPITHLRLCQGRHVTAIALPFAAASVSRRVLDEALLAQAASAGAQVRRGSKAAELVGEGPTWRVRLDDGTSIVADAVFLATGKHDLHGHERPPGLHDDLVAFKLHWWLAPGHADLDDHVELVLFEGGYAGLQRIEAGRVNLCLLIRRQRLRALGPRWDGVLAAIRSESPHLDARLRDAMPCWPRPLALAAIPSGHVRLQAEGLWRLGDQAVVIPSFAGDGMSIALHSAELAAATYLAGGDADAYQRRLARDMIGRVGFATILSQALVRPSSQRAIGWAARSWPGLMSTIAAHTRVPEAALARARARWR